MKGFVRLATLPSFSKAPPGAVSVIGGCFSGVSDHGSVCNKPGS